MLSVIIHTKNSSKTLKKALQSVNRLADEIIVVDMHSDDNSVEIAKKHTKHIFTFKDVGYVEPARNFAIKKAKGDWIFILDADEEVPAKLETEIHRLVTSEHPYNAFFIPRKNLIFGTWMEHTGWWPDFQLRLFRSGSVTWKDEIHSVPEIDGDVDYIASQEELAIVHHNYETISEYLQRLDKYSTIQASEDTSVVELYPKSVINTFSDEFLRRMFQWHGTKDGVHGVALSFLQSLSEVVRLLKQWETTGKKTGVYSEDKTIESLEKFRDDIDHWITTYKLEKAGPLEKVRIKVKRRMGVK